jgi:hypothetical protein
MPCALGFHFFYFSGLPRYRFGNILSQRWSKEADGGVGAGCCSLCSVRSSPLSSGCNSTGIVLLPPRSCPTHPRFRHTTLHHNECDGKRATASRSRLAAVSSRYATCTREARLVLPRARARANVHVNDGLRSRLSRP